GCSLRAAGLWRLLVEADLGLGARMAQAQPPRVEHRTLRPVGLASSVLDIPRQRMAERREVDANLMRPPGVEVTAQESMPAPSLDHLVTGARETAALHHRHAQPVLGVAADRTFQLAGRGLETPERDGEIGAAERSVLELGRKSSVARIVSGDHYQA